MTNYQYPGAPSPLNDEEREDWINNDEGLYDAQIASGLTMQDFINANREQIDLYINAVRTDLRPAHFGKYGG